MKNFADIDSGASFRGSGSSTSWYLPGLYDNYYNYYSTVIVQNSVGTDINATLEVFPSGSQYPVYQATKTIKAYESESFELEGKTELAQNQTYSGKVTATGNVVSMVSTYGRSTANNQLYAYNGFTGGARTVYAPTVMKNYYGYNSALVIQNIGASATTVTVTYYTNTGTYYQSQSVAPNAAWSIYVPSQSPSNLPSGDTNGLFSASVSSSSSDVVLMVNASNAYTRASTYLGFTQNSAATTMYIPNLDKNYSNFNSSVTCQMISGGPQTITIEYFDVSQSLGSTTSTNVENGRSVLFYTPNDWVLRNYTSWHGHAKVTSGGTVGCIVNQDMNQPPYSTYYRDMLFTYEGIR